MVLLSFLIGLIENNYFVGNLERERQRIFREMIESSVGLGFLNNRSRPTYIFNNLTETRKLNPNHLEHVVESKNHPSNMIRNLLRKIEGEKYQYMLGNHPI